MISGLIWWMVVGIIGATTGGWICGRMGGFPFGGLLGTIVTAFAGAVIYLWLVRLIKKA